MKQAKAREARALAESDGDILNTDPFPDPAGAAELKPVSTAVHGYFARGLMPDRLAISSHPP